MKKRSIYLDNVGAIMLLDMIFIVHAACNCGLNDDPVVRTIMNALACFMPWFYFKSGMFYKDRPTKEVIVHGFHRLIVPFIIWSFFGWFIIFFCGSILLSHANVVDLLKETIYDLAHYGAVRGNFALWFLPSLFFVKVIYNVFRQMKIDGRAILVVGLIGSILLNYFRLQDPIYLGNIAEGLFFFALGYELREIQFNKVLFGVSIGIFILQFFYPQYLDFRANEVTYGDNYYLALLYCISGILLFNNLFHLLGERNIPLLTYFGGNTMPYYLTHYIIILGFARTMTIVVGADKGWGLFGMMCIVLIVSFIVINWLYNNKRFSILFGKVSK